MIKFSLNQIKFLSATSVVLLSWQSMAIAGSSFEKKVSKQQERPLKIAQMTDNDVLVPNPTIKIDGKPVNQNKITPPPFLPRAVAPPVGDMAVSQLETMTPTIKLGTTALIPRLVLRDAPATEVLALIARAAGLNVIFTNDNSQELATVSLDLENEPIEEVFNSVLLISGLKANRQGNTIFVGDGLPNTVRSTITRTIRVNQYSAIGVATFLSSQGAKASIVEVTDEEGKRTFTSKILGGGEEGEDGSYLMLNGLTVHADPIHDAVTLVGEPYLIKTATHFIRQLDIRRRQVAVNVKIVDIDLNQDEEFGMTFLARFGDLVLDTNFGFDGLRLDFLNGFGDGTARLDRATLDAAIVATNGKVLTDPTMLVQEGQIGSIELVEDVITSVNTEIDTESGVRTVTPEIGSVGLTLDIAIQKIDDNGFVNLVVNPEISSIASTEFFDSGAGAQNEISLLNRRTVSSGLIRLRDAQTLVLSGIITDAERSTVSKVPLLGDLPLLGSLFRTTSTENERSEVVVLLTPQVLDDSQSNSGTGYNYNPTPETQEFLDDRGLNMPRRSEE